MSSASSRPLCTERVQFPASNVAMFSCGRLVQGRVDAVRSGRFRQRACFMQLRHDHFSVGFLMKELHPKAC
eukprot:5906867-Prymnesium_polylepis.2